MSRETFYQRGDGFVSVCKPYGESCPPYIIASVASNRVVEGADFALPEGYDDDVLGSIRGLTGNYYKPVDVSTRQAQELRQIGAQLLELDAASQIEPPLSYGERSSIQHLLSTVPETQ